MKSLCRLNNNLIKIDFKMYLALVNLKKLTIKLKKN